MENSAIIREPISSPEIQAFARGFGDGPIQGPAHVAWLLESAALSDGWRPNEVVGSEAELIGRFATSRDVIRGAIRIVEARGSMKMRRGCQGGLLVQVPSVESAAVALAISLRSQGYTLASFAAASRIICPLLPASPTGQAIRAMVERAVALVSDGATLAAGSVNRAEIFAMRIIDKAGFPQPEGGVRIGTEAQMCDAFGLTHRTFRQALNILDDLAMLQVRRGRGGGYYLKPATSMSVIRRIFVLLASRQATIAETNAALWTLGTARLRILFDAGRGLTRDEREDWAAAVRATFEPLPEPRRWVHVQHAICDLAGDRLIKTLTSAMVAFAARTEPPPSNHHTVANRLLAAEHGLVEAVAAGRLADAERHLAVGQELLTALAGTSPTTAAGYRLASGA